jgi:hypothetical protein
MIRPNLRAKLTAADLDLAIDLLARGRDAGRRYYADLMREEGPDRLLDQPDLALRLRQAPGVGPASGPLFFYVLVRHTLRASGIDDVKLSDYLGSLLLEFGSRDRAHRITPHDDAVHRYLVDLLHDLGTADNRRTFLLLAHLGNYSLWLAGIFPDYIEARSGRNGGPDVGYYDRLGARGFRLAAEHGLARELDLDGIFGQAADAYPLIRGALNRLAAEVFWPRAA